MSIISKIFGKLFGKSKPAETPADDYMSRWEKERTERIQIAEAELKDWIIATVKEKGTLSFSWESGNDEAFVTFNNATLSDTDNFNNLESYIIDKLAIPDAGEFQMNGRGEIYRENDVMKVKYSSTMKEIIDFDEETEQEIYGEEEEESVDTTLFTI